MSAYTSAIFLSPSACFFNSSSSCPNFSIFSVSAAFLFLYSSCSEWHLLSFSVMSESSCSASFISAISNDIEDIKNELEEDTARLYKAQENDSILKARKSMLEERISRMKEQQLKINAGHDKLNDIEKIYGVKLVDGLGEDRKSVV